MPCFRVGSERAPLLGSVRSGDPGVKRGPGAGDAQSGGTRMSQDVSRAARTYGSRRKLASCVRSYWTLICLQIHVLKAVAQGWRGGSVGPFPTCVSRSCDIWRAPSAVLGMG
ncbi:protein sidekick-1 isoform X2 [Clarias magur]|uniref:Protein sidekick-1 isoform X2 n=1 Tax=Clarias magur TaxID=1594786 RepID=A0A8J4UMT0_CLAMG|nr:protein sidekick-1 isoform X2 [Clarias magur]